MMHCLIIILVLYSIIVLLFARRSSSETFPRATLQVLREHYDEVWYCRFSPNGHLLATGTLSSTIVRSVSGW